MNEFKFLILGFFVKIITGLDDTITSVPAIASITRTRMGKIAFSIGTLAAVSVAILIATVFSELINNIPHYRYITAGLIVFLAIAIYFDLFIHKPKSKAEKNFFVNKLYRPQDSQNW